MFNRKIRLFNANRTENKNIVPEHLVQTIKTTGIHGTDYNKDGIPDYMQRPEISSIIKANKEFSQWDIDTAFDIEQWINSLYGYEFLPTTNTYLPVAPPKINKIGVNFLKAHMFPILNRHGINTTLTDDEVHDITKDSTIQLIRWFKYNSEKIEADLSSLSAIVYQADHFTYLVLSRAKGDRQRMHISDRLGVRSQHMPPQQQPAFPAGT